MRVGILQPGYLPWLGFFDQIDRTDIFVLLDDVQYTKNDWRNRNRIRLGDRAHWLTVPVVTAGLAKQRIDETRIDGRATWGRKHLASIEAAYKRAPFADALLERIRPVLTQEWDLLIDLDESLLRATCALFGIETVLLRSSSLPVAPTDDPSERLVEICRAVEADTFLEGASGKSYLDVQRFTAHDIKVEFQTFPHPVYPQQGDPDLFISHLAAIDLLANVGPASLRVLRETLTDEAPTPRRVLTADEAT